MTHIISISVLAAAVCSCAATQGPRDFSPQVAERGAQQDSRSGHMKIYMAGMIASSEAGVELRDSSLSGAVARIHWRIAYNLVEARLLLRAVVLTVNLIFHQLWQACVQLSRARILDGTLGQRSPFVSSGAYQSVLVG